MHFHTDKIPLALLTMTMEWPRGTFDKQPKLQCPGLSSCHSWTSNLSINCPQAVKCSLVPFLIWNVTFILSWRYPQNYLSTSFQWFTVLYSRFRFVVLHPDLAIQLADGSHFYWTSRRAEDYPLPKMWDTAFKPQWNFKHTLYRSHRASFSFQSRREYCL